MPYGFLCRESSACAMSAWKDALVVKLVGKHISFTVLRERLK